MSNLSQIKREEMISFLETLKKLNVDDEQIKAINGIESFLDEKRYGLVWEEHEEAVDVKMKSNIPVFTEAIDKKIEGEEGTPTNFLVEGDNLHTLYLLEKSLKSRIDVIYIDPPYNTGNKDFMYDDTFVDKEDSFRHSKWVSFMEKRLRVARELLTNDGVIFVSIDENEQANLELLLDDVFGPDNKIGEFIWKGRSGKGGTNSQIAYQHEYIKVYAKNAMVVNFYQIQTVSDKEKTENLRQWGDNAPFRVNRPTMFFPVLIKGESYLLPTDEELVSIYNKETSFDDQKLQQIIKKYESQGYTVVLPMREDADDGYGRWRQGVPGFKNLISANLLTHAISKDGEITLKKIIPSGKESTIALDSILDTVGTSADGTKEIKRMFGKKVFDTTKPLDLIKYLVYIGTFNKPNAIVLDFFAGSGTTGEAVIELNKEHGGKRRFILATNNENNIAQDVTLERMSMVSNGYEATAKYKEVIYEEKLTPTRLKQMDAILKNLASIQEENANIYEKITIEMNGSNVCLVGERDKKFNVPGLGFAMKYYTTEFVERAISEDGSLTDDLLEHIKEMAEIEYGVDLDDRTNVRLILDEEELDKVFEEDVKNIVLLIPTFVLMRGNQIEAAQKRNIDIVRVPDYYFAAELREAGEL